MPITIKHGSIFDSTADVLVCPVNCVGVMGAGLALEFKRRWPEMFEWYQIQCQKRAMWVGSAIYLDEFSIMLCATKSHWKYPSKMRWVDNCLFDLVSIAMRDKITSIALPQLGCGCGGLDWAEVWPLYEKHLGGLDADVEVWIHE